MAQNPMAVRVERSRRVTAFVEESSSTAVAEARPKVVVPPHDPITDRDEADRRTLNQIFDLHRICAQNKEYFAWKASRYEKFRKASEIGIDGLVVLTAFLLCLAAMQYFENPDSKFTVEILMGTAKATSGLAFLLVAIKNIMAWSSDYEECCGQFDEYRYAFMNLDKLVRNIKEAGRYDENQHHCEWDWARELVHIARSRDPASSLRSERSRRKFDQIQLEINRQYPLNYYMNI